jgi:two-component system, LytTR family, response regulator
VSGTTQQGTIRALLVDDERLARMRLERLLTSYPGVEVAGMAENGRQALDLIKEENPDVIFLDIRMPVLGGFELLEKLKDPPYIIFTTAYDEYALQAFRENTVDYLVKPISEESLDRALGKLARIFERGEAQQVELRGILEAIRRREEYLRRFSVRVGEKIIIIPEGDIVCFQAEEKYTFLHTADASHIIPYTLRQLEARLDPEKFVRVHRSCIINIEAVKTIRKWFGGRLKLTLNGDIDAEVSARHLASFKKMINL